MRKNLKMSHIHDFILNTIEHYYRSPKLELDEKLEETLSDFIYNAQSLLLQSFVQNNTTLFLFTKVQGNEANSLIFYKTSPQDLTSENAAKNINIISLSNNAAQSLYYVLRQIYSPLLAAGNDLYSNKLQKNLLDLESNLRILTHESVDEKTYVILSVEDERDYWKALSQRKETSKKEREAASSFYDFFEDICEEVRSMQSSPMPEVREAAENIGGILDDVWRFTVMPYPQDKMMHVFDIVGHVICSVIQKSVSNLDLWKAHNGAKDNELLILLSDGLRVIETWISACKSLTETYWPNYALHQWNDKPYVPPLCTNFYNRLKQIHDIRSTYCQLNKLLTNNEKQELMTDKLFEPFKDVNIWICNRLNTGWENAVSRFSSNLRPIETKIAEKLRPRLHNTSTKQMLYEFMRYRTLIARPLVKSALNSELEIFVSSLSSMLKTIQDQLDSDEVAVKMYQPPEMSPIVQQVQWAKQMEAKVEDIQMCAEKYLKEFEGSSELLKLAVQVLKDLKTMYTQLHEEWSRDLQIQVKNGSLQLALDKPVVEFSASSRLMVVKFNPRLVWAELEARALAALGLRPPPAAAAIDTLSAALGHARALQQVASFHNTLGERMIPSTRPMMLQAALDLSSLVQDQKAVYWNDVEQLANYTEKLKKIVLKLESQNTYLTRQHMAIRSIVEKLLDTEVLAKQSEWKKQIKEIRDIIEKVEANGYKNTELWKSHWDWQLYKVLECQYIWTLLSLHKYFPHVKVDLMLRGRMVRVQPALEEIRVQHYHQLRRLVALPAHFVGLQTNVADNQTIFSTIVDKHSWLGNKAVKQLEAALSSVQRVCDAWTRRAALACAPDLDALCRQHLHEPHHWEINFKACKAYGQAVAKMTFEDEKIDWISVSTAALRREFEAQARNLWACLMSSLQTSCRTDAESLDTFIANATVMLENKSLPKNAKELTEISAKQQALQEKIPEMEKTVDALKRKGHMLRTWGGDMSVDNTIKEWLKIRELMQSQQQIFEHQAEIVKSSLNGEWDNLNSSVEAWLSRWSQTRSRFEETHGVEYTEMIDRCHHVFNAQTQWEKFLTERDDLMKECEKFNMKLQLSETWQQAEKIITEDINLWTILKTYNEEYKSIAEQEWIVFQKKLHLLDELVSKWSSQLEPYTIVTLYMQQELDKYSDLTMLLKYLRGNDFTERHWREIYSLLEMEFKEANTLLLQDFLNVAVNIKKQIKALQKICISAANEAAIRSALNELELWFAGAKFTIIYYNDKSKRPTPIVQDFKEILNKVEEQQWVVSSVSGGGGGGGDSACASWESRLRAARALLRAAHHAQRRWLYLEPILSNDDGELGTKFRKVDQGFRQVTRVLETDPRLSALLQSSRLQPMLDTISEQLLACQSSLNQYIDEKRSAFPRLYFLSDDDLLELLGQARAGAEGRETVMQTHLKKLFPGTTGVRLGPGGMSITALCSQYEEILQLDHPVDIDCPVELWLKNLETEMRSSLKNMTLKCVMTSSLQDQDPFSLPTQILCLTQNIRFTEQTERSITSKELHKLKASIEKEYLYYTTTEVDSESERQKRQALILQCAHYMFVIRTLIDKNVVSIEDWLWKKQLRFYLLSTKEVVAKMGLAQISYSYEYLGVNTGQFVRTELADECFLILTQSLHLGFVGNPFGPAGTGKTESVKALGSLVGRLVLIFNCDEAMDAKCMGRLLSGLALCGAWGCFDEFNRLTGDTLAAVSHQFASLLNAMQRLKSGSSSTALLNGKHVSVCEWCGVAATMNPAGRGYGGRRELPAALQRALRPIAMTRPRGDQLAGHLLAARCVTHADTLALDLNTVFDMANGLLSGHRHYDWGLRALKAAVGSCGAALAALKNDTRTNDSVVQQRATLRHVLRLNNRSKLTSVDANRFENILSMVFAGVPEEESTKNPINSALESSADTLGLMRNKFQLQKCIEVYEQLQQRMGVVIVGPPSSGKTTIRRLLKTALMQQGKNIVEYIICPKAMCRSWLLGEIDHDTRQWTDGVISATALEVSNQPLDVWSWVVCDGDIDPEWIEALNSVLDDNRLLTLPSGWRIQFGPNVNFLFETHSLEHASPATVSRMGIILLSEENCCVNETLGSWLQKTEFESDTVKTALPLLEQTIKKCMQWFTTHRSDTNMRVYNQSLLQQMLSQFEYIAKNLGGNIPCPSSEELVYLVVQRSIMGLLKENAIDSFYQEMSQLLGPLPMVAPEPVGEWATDSLYLSPRVSACEAAVRACTASDKSHLLLVGPNACAKNSIIDYVLKESNSTVISVDCTPMLEPTDIIAELKRKNVVRVGGRSPCEGGARVTLAVRALHRARLDAWGSSRVHSFLLQLIQQNGFWVRGEGEDMDGGAGGMQWCAVPRMRVLATATTAATTQPRLANALSPIVIQEPDDEELLELVRTYLRRNLDKNIQNKEVFDLAGNLLSMFKEVTSTFDTRLHYKWNTLHLRKWCENLKWYSLSNIAEVIMAAVAEANMIFRDRLVTDDEKATFNTISRNHLKGNNEGVYFTCKLRGDGVYLEALDHRDWYQSTQKLINQCLTEYEYNVFGEDGVEVCSELSTLFPAITRAAGGGVCVCACGAGAGRRAAARLAAAALRAALHTAAVASHARPRLQQALASAGEGTRTLLVLCEAAAADEATLARVELLQRANSLHALPANLRPSASNAQRTLDNIKQNLGIVICLDKNQENLSELMDKYPLLYNDSNLVWIDRWSNETLRQMPQLIIQRLIKENVTEKSSEQHETIPVEGFVNIYNSLDVEWMRAPCRYINFVKTYYHIVIKKKTALVQRQSMLSSGVEALKRARGEVATLQSEAALQEAELSDKQAQANHALDQIGATVRANTDKREEMHALKRNIETENEKLQIRKKEIEAELASVEPVIAAAREAVGDIRPESLSEVRSLRAPPDVVRDILEGVLRLMGIADTSWHSMKNFLSKRGVKEDIRCLDASQISAEAASSVRRLLERRGASFEPPVARRASAACAPLAAWVRANLAYADALARVRPLQEQQRALHRNLAEAEQQMASLSSGLETVEQRVGALKEQLGRHTRDAAALELRLAAAGETIAAARDLLDQLANEYTVWETDLENISKEILELSQRSLLTAAYIVYLPNVTEPKARDYINNWSTLIGFEDVSFSVINFLSTTEKQLKWEADGLPSDQSAVKNAVIIDQYLEAQKCGFTPLIIDPDGVAVAWLKSTLADSHCDFVPQHSERFSTAVQYATRLGRMVVVTEVEDVSAEAMELMGVGGALGVAGAAGARVLLVAREGQLATRLSPHLTARFSTLNFTIHLHGLIDQLTYHALQQQNPEMNEKYKEIKLNIAVLQKQQYELQEKLLVALSSAGDVLHDAGVARSLREVRAAGGGVAEALRGARAAGGAAAAARAAGGAAAARLARLALCARALHSRRAAPPLPLDLLANAYVDALRHTHGTSDDEVVKYATRRIIERILLGLHEKDKYAVVLHLLKEVYEDLVPEKLWNVFIGSYDFVDHDIIKEVKQNYPWIHDDCISKVARLKVTSEDFFEKMSLYNEKLWKEFLLSGNLNVIDVLKLNVFETVIAVAAIRPASLYRAIVAFVEQVLGGGAAAGGEALGRAVRSGGRATLLLAAHAADVLAAHAHAHDYHLTQVGVEEGRSAWEAAVETTRSGGWLALIVGASPFTLELQEFIVSFTQRPAEDFNPEFRLWIVSEEREIPPIISNACVNVILEAPEGVKCNVLSTLSAWGNYVAEPKLVRAHACLALFHALVQERRAYIPQGWSRWYAWEWGEVAACAAAVRDAAGGAGAVGTWRALCACVYGARVVSAGDRRALSALARDCFAERAFAHGWRPRSLDLRLPLTDRLQAYTKAFDALPDIDTAQLLGLPSNCRIAWEKKAADDIIAGLKELNTTIDINKKNEGATPLKALLTLWKKLMSNSPFIKGEYNEEETGGVSGGGARVSWWRCVCGGEAREACVTAHTVHRALAHHARNTHHAHHAHHAHRNDVATMPLHTVPDDWQLLWPGPDSVDTYLKEFSHRAHAAVSRLDTCNINEADYMPAKVDLRSFLHPTRVIWALRAHTAARLGCTPNSLCLTVKWNCEVDDKSPRLGLVVVGLCVCGGAWSAEGALAPARADAAPHERAPPLLLRYVPQYEESAMITDRMLDVPVYCNETREQVVFNARAPLASIFDHDAAVLNSVALFVAPTD